MIPMMASRTGFGETGVSGGVAGLSTLAGDGGGEPRVKARFSCVWR